MEPRVTRHDRAFGASEAAVVYSLESGAVEMEPDQVGALLLRLDPVGIGRGWPHDDGVQRKRRVGKVATEAPQHDRLLLSTQRQEVGGDERLLAEQRLSRCAPNGGINSRFAQLDVQSLQGDVRRGATTRPPGVVERETRQFRAVHHDEGQQRGKHDAVPGERQCSRRLRCRRLCRDRVADRLQHCRVDHVAPEEPGIHPPCHQQLPGVDTEHSAAAGGRGDDRQRIGAEIIAGGVRHQPHRVDDDPATQETELRTPHRQLVDAVRCLSHLGDGPVAERRPQQGAPALQREEHQRRERHQTEERPG